MKKINWGQGIIISFVIFIGFIMYFVIKASVVKDYNHDLVFEDYYQKELAYQEDIERLKNSQRLKQKLRVQNTKAGLVIVFPSGFDVKKIKGTIFCYRPSNKRLDFKKEIELFSQTMLLSQEKLIKGRWNIYIYWEYENEKYLNKIVVK